ncbi:AraC family transcriptional regulator [Bremerella sp. JC770]|uniref:AraC family transcriptional regulator n=1 Tax=Bremerella sp. JC770 TaxID=3232137 RepID=UPI003458E09B
MSPRGWDKINDPSPVVAERFVGLHRVSHMSKRWEFSEQLMSEAFLAKSYPNDDFFLSLVATGQQSGGVEHDFGAGAFVRPTVQGSMTFGDERYEHRCQGNGPIHSYLLFWRREWALERMRDIAQGQPFSLEVLHSKTIRDEGLEILMRRMATKAKLAASQDDILELDEIQDSIFTRLLSIAQVKLPQHPLSGRCDSSLVRTAIDYIQANLSSSLTIEELAAVTGVSRSQFTKVFRQASQMSVRQYILHVRSERAKWLLRNTEDDLQAIAKTCGYHDHPHFCREFVKHVGVSPNAFRQQC